MDATKKYENLIRKVLKNKFNLLNQESYEDLLQEGKRMILEGLRTKYDEKRGSVCTFLYLYLNSQFTTLNQKHRYVFYPRRWKERVNFETKPKYTEENNKTSLSYDTFVPESEKNVNVEDKQNFKIDFHRVFSKLSDTRKKIVIARFADRKTTKVIAKELGDGWNRNRVEAELKKIEDFFKKIV